MPVYTPPDVRIQIFTFKEGLLSKVAHDLMLEATRATVELDPAAGRVRATIPVGGLRVQHAIKDGRPDPGELSASNKAEIEDNLAREVLDAKRHPEIVFEATAVEGGAVVGRLSMHGQSRAIRLPFAVRDGVATAEVRLDQRDWGVKPYRALMGALKVQPEVRVVVSVPWR